MEILLIVLVCLACLFAAVALVFFLGPALLGAFFKKADEWAEIIKSMKGKE